MGYQLNHSGENKKTTSKQQVMGIQGMVWKSQSLALWRKQLSNQHQFLKWEMRGGGVEAEAAADPVVRDSSTGADVGMSHYVGF